MLIFCKAVNKKIKSNIFKKFKPSKGNKFFSKFEKKNQKLGGIVADFFEFSILLKK